MTVVLLIVGVVLLLVACALQARAERRERRGRGDVAHIESRRSRA
jgi:competence protein ComGC